MRSVNKVILIGNLTRDPELRQTPSGQSICTFGIATNREWASREGSKHSLAEFHELVAWAKLAEICGEYLKKGKLIYIEGYLKTRSWDTPEGVRRHKTEIVIHDMIMLEKRPREEGESEEYLPEEDSTPPGEAAVKKGAEEGEKEPASAKASASGKPSVDETVGEEDKEEEEIEF